MDETEDKNGRCISCGFLAKFDLHYDGPPPYIYEMPGRDRISGEMSQIHLAKDHPVWGSPFCYANADDLYIAIQKVKQQHGQTNFGEVHTFFDQDRQCNKWHPYTKGFSPQQHLEEVRMQELELKRQAFELKMQQDHEAVLLRLDKRNRNFS